MKQLKKPVITTTILILILAISTVMSLNFAKADITTNIDTFTFISPAPSTIGVNQQVIVTFLVDKVNPVALIRSNFFTGFMITITKPDGTTETKGPLSADSTSTGWFTYTPTQVGTYYFEAAFPGQWANSTAGTMTMFGPVLQNTYRWYKPSTSSKVPLTVQDAPVQRMTNPPFPTDYWTTPVNSENKGWTAKIDNWLMAGYDVSSRSFNGQGAFSPYTTAANSAHVVWTEPIAYGGLVSEQFGDKSYYTGLVYEQFYMPIILNGRIIYNAHGPTSGGGFGPRTDFFGAYCLDLYTGEQIWYMENVVIDFAQTLSVDTPNEHGVLPYLWEAPLPSILGPGGPVEWKMRDAWTGVQILSIENATPGTVIFGAKGEVLSYMYDVTTNTLSLWNSSRCVFVGAPPSGPGALPGSEDFWSPAIGTVIDWKAGVEWNVTVPSVTQIGMPSILAISLVDNAVLVGTSALLYPSDQPTYPPTFTHAAFPATLQKQADGTYPKNVNALWVKDHADIHGWVELHWNINEGMYSMYDDAAQRIHTYDVKTGNELSVTEPISNPQSLWAVFSHSWMAYGRTYIWGYDGHVRAFDGKTGALVWDYALPSAGLETVYGTYPIYAGCTIADGKVYVSPDEHSPDADMWRGSKLYCLDADNGNLLWSISGYYHYQTVSNGYVTTVNSYEQTIYTFGKGPSATTVNAPDTAVPKGTTMIITGKVTDQSPAQKDTPCISDADQGAWMEYLHMQKPKPTSATGVSVRLTATDSNGNAADIGTATSDSSGLFKKSWTPSTEGEYTITATFDGTQSYGSSSGTTAVVVTTGGTSAVTQTSDNSATNLYIIVATVLVIIAIAAAVLILRKR